MQEKTLVIMAAGLGSRYGGLKQIDKIDDYGHILLDYSVYDAIRSGFGRVVFIIRRENYEDFKEVISSRMAKWDIELTIVFQEIECLLWNRSLPNGRKKPWGTAHAIACLKDAVYDPFVVINADDYYGNKAFNLIGRNLYASDNSDCYMLGYRLKNTLSKNGGVSRGICRTEDGILKDITERAGIHRLGEKILTSDGEHLNPESIVSMNLWAFTPEIIDFAVSGFSDFLEKNFCENPLCCEYYLPMLISSLISAGRANVKVITCDEIWHGVTYKEDKESLSSALNELTDMGVYPYGF